MLFFELPYEVAVAYRDHVVAREPYRLRDLAQRMRDSGGPLDEMDATVASLVPLWRWFVQYVLDGAPGVPDDAVPSSIRGRWTEGPGVRGAVHRRGAVAVEGVAHYARLVMAKVDPPSLWGVHVTRGRGRGVDGIHHQTGVVRSDGQVGMIGHINVGVLDIVQGEPKGQGDEFLRTWVLALLDLRDRPPSQEPGPSVLEPYLHADLGPMPPEARISPWLEYEAPAADAPQAPDELRAEEMTLFKGPASGLDQEPGRLTPLPADRLAAALTEAGFQTEEGRGITAGDLQVDGAEFTHRDDVALAAIAVHEGRVRALHLEPITGTQGEWDQMITPLQRLARSLRARLQPDSDIDDEE